jgi:hypothetical protein
MTNSIRRSDLIADARSTSEVHDNAIVDRFKLFRASLNAEAAFCAYLDLACRIAVQRPHLFEPLLPTVIDPAYCMGVDSAQGFIEYATFLIEQDAQRMPEFRHFSEDATTYFRQSMGLQLAAIQHALKQKAAS